MIFMYNGHNVILYQRVITDVLLLFFLRTLKPTTDIFFFFKLHYTWYVTLQLLNYAKVIYHKDGNEFRNRSLTLTNDDDPNSLYQSVNDDPGLVVMLSI